MCSFVKPPIDDHVYFLDNSVLKKSPNGTVLSQHIRLGIGQICDSHFHGANFLVDPKETNKSGMPLERYNIFPVYQEYNIRSCLYPYASFLALLQLFPERVLGHIKTKA
jgi:hypothetical protein